MRDQNISAADLARVIDEECKGMGYDALRDFLVKNYPDVKIAVLQTAHDILVELDRADCAEQERKTT